MPLFWQISKIFCSISTSLNARPSAEPVVGRVSKYVGVVKCISQHTKTKQTGGYLAEANLTVFKVISEDKPPITNAK